MDRDFRRIIAALETCGKHGHSAKASEYAVVRGVSKRSDRRIDFAEDIKMASTGRKGCMAWSCASRQWPKKERLVRCQSSFGSVEAVAENGVEAEAGDECEAIVAGGLNPVRVRTPFALLFPTPCTPVLPQRLSFPPPPIAQTP